MDLFWMTGQFLAVVRDVVNSCARLPWHNPAAKCLKTRMLAARGREHEEDTVRSHCMLNDTV